MKSPPIPQPLSTPAGAERGANHHIWPTLLRQEVHGRRHAEDETESCQIRWDLDQRELDTKLKLTRPEDMNVKNSSGQRHKEALRSFKHAAK
jgi:hypothetical protein